MVRCPKCNHKVREYKSGRISPRHKLDCKIKNDDDWNNLLITAYKFSNKRLVTKTLNDLKSED